MNFQLPSIFIVPPHSMSINLDSFWKFRNWRCRESSKWKSEVWSWLKLKYPNCTIDYGREDSRFPVSASCITFSSPDSLSNSETGVNPGRRNWNNHLSEWGRCQKTFDGICFTKKWRSDITSLFRIWQFQTSAQQRHQLHFLAVRFAFWWWSWFSRKENQDLLYTVAPKSPLHSPIFLSSHL